jgi:SHS family lactate transporter-like MFS transporter
MGGEWGVGASLAMETAPAKWRGLLSGILQSGYSMGYILAAVAARLILPHFAPDFGWRVMFWVGGLPALLALYIRSSVPESEAWKQHRVATMRDSLRILRENAGLMIGLVIMMTFFMFLSHGTQDLYPDFLKTVHHFSQNRVADLAIFYNVGAVVGAMIFGQLSERRGRRFAVVAALALALLVIPFWAFGPSLLVLAAGSFLMQVGVQGAWGVVPAHLNELSPDSVRGLVPGLAYQLGILCAAGTNSIEFALQHRFGYQWALAGFETVVIVCLATAVILGTERRGKQFIHLVT